MLGIRAKNVYKLLGLNCPARSIWCEVSVLCETQQVSLEVLSAVELHLDFTVLSVRYLPQLTWNFSLPP